VEIPQNVNSCKAILLGSLEMLANMAPVLAPMTPAPQTAPMTLPTMAPAATKSYVKAKGMGRVRARRRAESLSNAGNRFDCNQVQRTAYNAIQDQSSSLWTSTCRDYIGRHKTHWVCQFD
jgi:hypothetical protein